MDGRDAGHVVSSNAGLVFCSGGPDGCPMRPVLQVPLILCLAVFAVIFLDLVFFRPLVGLLVIGFAVSTPELLPYRAHRLLMRVRQRACLLDHAFRALA